MCISKLYIIENGSEKLLIPEVLYLYEKGGRYIAVDLERKEHILEGCRIRFIDFIKHKIVMEKAEV